MPDRIIPRPLLAAEARGAIEAHDEWDAPHAFATLHWDGGKLSVGMRACITTDVDPRQYPAYMAKIAAGEMKADPPPVAYLLQVESFGVEEPGPGASAAERRTFDAARLGRTFHELPGAVESATCWVADIYGRLWAATHTRDDPGVIAEKFYPPDQSLGGHLIRALLDVAAVTGQERHGMPRRAPQ